MQHKVFQYPYLVKWWIKPREIEEDKTFSIADRRYIKLLDEYQEWFSWIDKEYLFRINKWYWFDSEAWSILFDKKTIWKNL